MVFTKKVRSMTKILFALLLSVSSYCYAGIPVLMYHQVTNDKPAGDTTISPEKFAEQMKFLHDNGYKTISLDELVDYMNNDILLSEDKTVVLTFDDGWKSALDNAVPVLDKYDMKADFNIIAEMLVNSSPEYASKDDLSKLLKNDNFEIESHSVTHPEDIGNNLQSWDEGKTQGRSDIDVLNEIVVSKYLLNQITDIHYFVWPAGWSNNHLIQMVKQTGYKGSLLAWGEDDNNTLGGDPYRITRIDISGQCSLDQFKERLEKGTDAIKCGK